MSEAVYHLDGVRFKALAYLRTHGPSTVEQIAAGLGMPDWAIRPALDSAGVAQLAEPTADGVWAIKAPVRAAA